MVSITLFVLCICVLLSYIPGFQLYTSNTSASYHSEFADWRITTNWFETRVEQDRVADLPQLYSSTTRFFITLSDINREALRSHLAPMPTHDLAADPSVSIAYCNSSRFIITELVGWPSRCSQRSSCANTLGTALPAHRTMDIYLPDRLCPDGWIRVPYSSGLFLHPLRITSNGLVLTCPPNPDPPTMRVPTAAGSGLETLDHEADKAFGGTDRDEAA